MKAFLAKVVAVIAGLFSRRKGAVAAKVHEMALDGVASGGRRMRVLASQGRWVARPKAQRERRKWLRRVESNRG